MAACNVNGLLRQYVGFSLNGSTSNSVGPIREHTAFDEIKHTKPTQTMAPRTVMEHNLVPHVPNGLSVASTVHVSKETPELVDDQHVVRSDVPDGSTRLQKIVPPESGGKMSCLVLQHTDEHSSLESRRFSCKRRLEVCTERLDSLRDRSLALLNRLLAAKLPETFTVGVDDLTQLPESLCRLLDDEETESESDEEPSTQPRPCSSHEENWLCSRAVSCSDWHWLVSEIKRSDRCIKNFRLLRSSLQKWKSGLAIHDPECDIDSSCSRATPFTPRDRRRHSYHNLASPKCARLIGELNKEYNDPCVHCSCVPHHTGPCILCCGASPSNWIPPCDQPQCVDLLHSARPLGAHIHPKLSLPGDVQLSLRLESRLATPSNFTFREHKSTLHPVNQEDKPCCLRSPRKGVQRRIRRVNGFYPLRNELKMESLPSRFQKELHSSQPLASSSSTTPGGSRPNPNPFRSHSKALNAPSALRRILNLAPDSEASADVLRDQSQERDTL